MKAAQVFETLEYGPAPESAAPALEWLDSHERRFGLFIGGRWVEPASGEWFDTVDPANGEPLARIAQAAEADVDAAVRAARAAQPAWQGIGGQARARYLYAIARHVRKHARMFAVLESLDNGKPIRESRDIDVPLVERHFYYHAGWAQLAETELSEYVPVGIAGQIIPWNFPLLMLAWKIAPALAAGNAVVLKPAELTSLTALRFAELCDEVGLPRGVVNIITGDGRTGEALVMHPDVDKIAFTGSTEVGRDIRIATAGSGKKLSLELGGKSPFIVFEDSDLDSVVEGVVDAIWFNQGQVCCAGSRILAQEGVAEGLAAKLRTRMETLRIGDPLDKAIDIGAIIAPAQLDKIRTLVQQGIAEGATLWQPSWSCPTDGYFYPPTLCTDVEPAGTLAQIEIFGPVVVLMTFRTPAEAVALANNTRYGLAASVWTENINLALDIAPKVKAGTVWINCTNVFDAAAGFGGYRESGFGREGGLEGLLEYLAPHWDAPVQRAADGDGSRQQLGAGTGQAHRFAGHPAGRQEQTSAAPETPPPSGGRSGGGRLVTQNAPSADSDGGPTLPPIDRTAKLYIGGRQTRPDRGLSLVVRSPRGARVGEVARGSRKDIRDAVEAAQRATDWARATAHHRAQVLYYLAENIAARHGELVDRLVQMVDADAGVAAREVDHTLARITEYAAWADKYDGAVHHTPFRNVTLAMPEPIGVIGIVCADDAPLLGFVSAVMPAIAMGNTTVAVPSETAPLAATDLYHVFDSSDVPAGVINLVTGTRAELAETLAAHDDVDGVWYFAGGDDGDVERLSAGNMKRTWVTHGYVPDWWDARQGGGREFLRHATQVKNIWAPYGE